MNNTCVQCKNPKAKFTYNRCQMATYCSKACQQAHWNVGNHAASCKRADMAPNIEHLTLENTLLHAPLYPTPGDATATVGKRIQVQLQSVASEIPWETHWDLTQFLRVEQGHGRLVERNPHTGAERAWLLEPGSFHVVEAGTSHLVQNTGVRPLQLYSVYAKDAAEKEWKH